MTDHRRDWLERIFIDRMIRSKFGGLNKVEGLKGWRAAILVCLI